LSAHWLTGEGIYGLITAKTLLHDSGTFFNSVVIFEKNSELGGVWASNRIYDGLTTNSPLLTYEIPGFPYPENLRGTGKHVKAQDVNFYLQAYAERYDLIRHTEFSTHVENIAWDSRHPSWTVIGNKENQPFRENFSHIVVCTGLYHARHIPLGKNQVRQFSGNIWHSSELFDRTAQETLGKSKNVVVVGAGKSAIDLATLIAQGRCSAETKGIIPLVKLVYRRPHWLSPRKILWNTIPFENLLFCRFVVSIL
jgi:cation diffusion facilitator CzcD-associated flavoprotein CzcO